MPPRLTCRLGHQWEPPEANSAGRLCPVCGGTAEGSSDPHDTLILPVGQTAEPPPIAEPAPAEAPSEYPPRFPGYEILTELGRGGAGTVFRARQTGCQRLVALKALNEWPGTQPVALRRFRREVRLLGRLDHAHIVPIYDAGESRGRPYCAMKLLEGGSLRRRIPALTADPVRAAGLLVKLAEAIHYAHDQGVIHRDLKPGNVLFDGRGEPYLVDFGSARCAEDDGPDVEPGLIVGTPAYMAPEQTVGGGVTGPATDVYGLGVILYELLTGRPPFRAASPEETIHLVQQAQPDRPRVVNPECPAELEDVCLRCLEKEPGRRPASARELADRLRDFLARAPAAALSTAAAVTFPLPPCGAEPAYPLEPAVDALADGVLVLDAAGKVVRANPAAARVLGRDLTGLSLPDWMACQGWLRADAVTPLSAASLPPAAALRGEAPADAEAYLVGGSSRGVWVVVSARPVAGEAGAVVTVRDVTARKAERDSGELYHSLMSSLGLHVFRKDLQGRYTFVNRPFCDTLRKPPEEVLGRTDFDLFSADLARVAREREGQVRETAGVVEYVEEHAPAGCPPGCRCRAFREPTDDGTEPCYLQVLLAPVRDESRAVIGIQGAFWNITVSRRAGRQVEQAAAALRQANAELARSNAELEQFAYVASHDLQEPLRMVASFTQLLRKRYQGRLDDEADQFIHFAVDGALRMQRLITDLLAYSRVRDRGQPLRDTSCEEAFDRAVQNLREAVREADATVTRAPLPRVKGDATQLVQLLQNLIGNALKFRGAARPVIHVGARRPAGRGEWLFWVRDNGIGIDPQHLERVFVIFQRLHTQQEYPGSGIGLAVCRKIVERHGGRIWAESEPGKGSSFYFTLPGG